MAVMWQKFSPTTLTLPSGRHLTSAITVDLELGESTKAYLKARRAKLKPKDFLVNVLIDEVYTVKQVRYVNGKFYGREESNIMKTLLCIMIKAVAGKYKDVIGLVPCLTPDAKKQHELWIKILPACKIGFEPIITMTDGNQVNHKFYKDICRAVLGGGGGVGGGGSGAMPPPPPPPKNFPNFHIFSYDYDHQSVSSLSRLFLNNVFYMFFKQAKR